MYTYCLEGYDDKEIVVDAQRHFATYNNLPSGSYLFHLKGTNEDGVWGKFGENPENPYSSCALADVVGLLYLRCYSCRYLLFHIPLLAV